MCVILKGNYMSTEQKKMNQYRSTIEHAKEFPFDANNEREMPVPLTLERLAAYSILTELKCRSGIDDALENIEIDDREELVKTLADIIKLVMSSE